MDLLLKFSLLAALIGLSWANDSCFQFYGNSFLKFSLLNFNNNNQAHYSMKFTTTNPHGLIMYSEGQHGDDEALYVRDGRLVYHLFNTSPTGTEGYFGGRFMGIHPVDTGELVEVHVYRTFNVTDDAQRRTRQQTGLVYTIGGRTYRHVDHRPRADITLRPDVYIGGYKESLSDTVGDFTGQISNIHEEKNEADFINFSLNQGGRVSTSCIANHQPV